MSAFWCSKDGGLDIMVILMRSSASLCSISKVSIMHKLGIHVYCCTILTDSKGHVTANYCHLNILKASHRP